MLTLGRATRSRGQRGLGLMLGKPGLPEARSLLPEELRPARSSARPESSREHRACLERTARLSPAPYLQVGMSWNLTKACAVTFSS